MSNTDAVESARSLCEKVGFDIEQLTPWLRARITLLGQNSETVVDAARMVGAAHRLFRFYETDEPSQQFSPEERRVVVLGCLFSDIGKSGPLRADAEGQKLVVEMFAVEGVRDDQQTVADFLRVFFPADWAERLRRFTGLGLDAGLPLRQFWNLHSQWTLEVAEAGGVPREAVAAAATHHLLENVNPRHIVAEDRRFTAAFGDNRSFDRAEKLIILLDKYDAARRRGRRGHAEAIAWLREKLRSNSLFGDDAEFAKLLADLDAALREPETCD